MKALVYDAQSRRVAGICSAPLELISDAAPPSQAEPVTLQDTSAWKLGFAWTAIRNALFTTTLHTGLEQHSSALVDNPQNLAIIDLPRRVYSLAGRTRIEFINEGPTLVTRGGVVVSRLESSREKRNTGTNSISAALRNGRSNFGPSPSAK